MAGLQSITWILVVSILACARAPLHATRDRRYLPQWFAGFSQRIVENSVLTSDGTGLYFATAKGRVVRANAKNGRPQWKVDLDGAVDGSPFVDRDAIYVGTAKGTAYALAKENGNTLWKRNLEREVIGQPRRVGEVVFFGTEGAQFYALDASTGQYLWKFKWEYSDKIIVSIFPSLAVGHDQILVGFPDGGLTLFAAKTGEKRWSVPGGGTAQFTDIAWLSDLSDGTLLSGAYSGQLQALNKSDGSAIWQIDGAASAARPTVNSLKGQITIAGEASIQRIDMASGKRIWAYVPKTPRRWSGILERSDDLLASTFDGEIHMLSKADGTLRWRWFFDGAIQGAPVEAQGRVWVLTKKGHLISLRK